MQTQHYPFLTRKELAAYLHISYDTLRRRLQDSRVALPQKKLLAPNDYLPILAAFGISADLPAILEIKGKGIV